jgi:hypothetical protein
MTQDSITPDDAALSAYLDGELPQDQADRLTERFAAEPVLARRLEAMRSTDHATRQLFAALDDMPIPKAVLELLQRKAPGAAKSNVIGFPVRVLRQFMQVPVAIAASAALLAGFLVHDLLRSDATTGSDLSTIVAGDVAAGSELFELLETGISSETQALAGGLRGRLLITFQDRSGDYCRQLHLSSERRSMQALACRRAGGWQVEMLDFEPASPSDGQYQQASRQSTAAVDAAIDALIGGNEPLDSAAESDLVRQGWKEIAD